MGRAGGVEDSQHQERYTSGYWHCVSTPRAAIPQGSRPARLAQPEASLVMAEKDLSYLVCYFAGEDPFFLLFFFAFGNSNEAFRAQLLIFYNFSLVKMYGCAPERSVGLRLSTR